MATPPQPKQLSPDQQTLMDDLLEQNAEGTISAADKARLVELVDEAEQLMVENSRQLADFAKRDSPAAPANAIPVTVWVKPSSTE